MLLTRRRLLATASVAGAAAGAGVPGSSGALAAAAGARPTRGSGVLDLVLQVSWQGATNYAGTSVQELTDQFLAAHWLAGHKGVRLSTQAGSASNGSAWNTTQTIDAVLTGTGPDIILACCDDLPGLYAAGVLRPIDPLIKTSNVDLAALFPPERLQVGVTTSGLMGLPDYGAQAALYWNQGMLDELGLAYPTSDWSYLDAARLWRQIAGSRKGQWVYGATLPFQAGHIEWLVAGFGGAASNVARTQCLLDAPQAQAAMAWLVPLAVDKVVVPSLWQLGNTPNVLAAGQAAFTPACCGTLQSAVLVLGDQVKWDFIPLPTFPAGRATRGGNGLYGINQMSRNPEDLVWDLYSFVTMGVPWQNFFNAQLALEPPSLILPEAWDDWMAVVRSVAPVLRTKNLQYVWDAALGKTVPDTFFAFNSDQATTILGNYIGQMEAGRITVQEGLAQAVREVNALEAASGATDALAASDSNRTASLLAGTRAGSVRVNFPAPSTAGVGTAAGDGSSLVAARQGVFTVRGSGGATTYTQDGTFACGTLLSSDGAVQCRLSGLSAASAGPLAGGQMAGLMARADLSDAAPMVWLGVVAGSGVGIDYQPTYTPGIAQQYADAGPGVGYASGGLLSNGQVLRASAAAGANQLLMPLWLRWVRRGAAWAAFASFDGTAWFSVGSPVPYVAMAGVWVGLFVADGGAATVTATFDRVSGFTPTQFAALGAG